MTSTTEQPRTRTRRAAVAVIAACLIGAFCVAISAPPAKADTSADEAQFLNLANASRASVGRPPLQYDAAATGIARYWSEVMASNSRLAHNPDLTDQISVQVASDWTRIAENVGYGPGVSTVYNAFMASAGHKANILGDFNRVGIGVVRVGDRIWVTMDFVKSPSAPSQPAAPPTMGEAMGPGAESWSADRLDVFQRGDDGAVWSKYWTGTNWSGWYSLGGSTHADPDAASWGGGRLDVFVLGLDGAIWHRAYQGGWMAWESLGGVLTSGPSAVSWSNDRIDVFARGLDGGLWSKYWSNGWSGWYPLGGTLIADPDVASTAFDRLDVFGIGADGQLWTKTWTGNGWNAWKPLGGQLRSAPGAVSWGNGRIDVFARGLDGSVWSRTRTSGSWGAWFSIGGSVMSAPDIASRGQGSLDVVARGLDGAIYQRSAAGNVWTGWIRLG